MGNVDKKPDNSGAHKAGLAVGATLALATGNAAMGAVGYGVGYGGKKLIDMYKQSPNAGGKHEALNPNQFK